MPASGEAPNGADAHRSTAAQRPRARGHKEGAAPRHPHQKEQLMVTVDLRALVGKLNDHCRRALEAAAGLCLSKTHYEVEIEHFLLKLTEQADGDVAQLFRHYEINHARATQELMRALDRLKTGNSRAPALSPRLPKVVQDAWLLASVQYDMP